MNLQQSNLINNLYTTVAMFQDLEGDGLALLPEDATWSYDDIHIDREPMQVVSDVSVRANPFASAVKDVYSSTQEVQKADSMNDTSLPFGVTGKDVAEVGVTFSVATLLSFSARRYLIRAINNMTSFFTFYTGNDTFEIEKSIEGLLNKNSSWSAMFDGVRREDVQLYRKILIYGEDKYFLLIGVKNNKEAEKIFKSIMRKMYERAQNSFRIPKELIPSDLAYIELEEKIYNTLYRLPFVDAHLTNAQDPEFKYTVEEDMRKPISSKRALTINFSYDQDQKKRFALLLEVLKKDFGLEVAP